MTEAFLPWLDKLQKLYKSRTYDGRDDSYTDSKGDQEWIQKTKERIEQKKSYEKLNKELYKCVSARDERTRTRIERTLVFVRVRPNMNEHEHGFFKKY